MWGIAAQVQFTQTRWFLLCIPGANFPRISSHFSICFFWGSFLFSTNQAKLSFLPGSDLSSQAKWGTWRRYTRSSGSRGFATASSLGQRDRILLPRSGAFFALVAGEGKTGKEKDGGESKKCLRKDARLEATTSGSEGWSLFFAGGRIQEEAPVFLLLEATFPWTQRLSTWVGKRKSSHQLNSITEYNSRAKGAKLEPRTLGSGFHQ